MFARSLRRLAAAATPAAVPDVMVTVGSAQHRIAFISHPGVMAVSKLLEMDNLIEHRAVFCQENVDAIREFDDELADKCQIALDNKLPMNMMNVEHLEKPGYLQLCLDEHKALEQARAEVAALPLGIYTQPKSVANYKRAFVPGHLVPERVLAPEFLEIDDLHDDIKLAEAVEQHLQKKQLAGPTATAIPAPEPSKPQPSTKA